MKVTNLNVIISLFCYLIDSPARLVSGLPLQRVLPGQVTAVAGENAVLRCHSQHPLRAMALEWSWFDDISRKIVYAMRDGEELVKEKAPEYMGRTSLMRDGSLMLSKVQPQDNGSYRCLIVDKVQQISKVFATLVVAQVSELNFTVRQTLASELFVLCDASGWSPKPIVTLVGPLGANGPPAKIEVSTRANGLYYLQALAMATEGSGVWTCKAELPGFRVVKENTLSIIDEFDHQQTEPCHLLMPFLLLVLVVLIIVIFFLPLSWLEKLRSLLQIFKVFLPDKSQMHMNETSFYGNIYQVDTSGASELTAKINNLTCRGKEASFELAENNHTDMLKYKDSIRKVGKNLKIHPALIAGIISRQSCAGTKINSSGYGVNDTNCYGLMQINKAYHAVKGDAFSEEHLDQGTTFLVQLIKTMQRTHPEWTKEQQLKGALACYISGEERVIPLEYENVDSVTPHGDFASDVIARAQWFDKNGF